MHKSTSRKNILIILMLSILLTCCSVLYLTKIYNEKSEVEVNFTIKNDQTRNYRIYYDNLKGDYPFGDFYKDGIIEEKKNIQNIRFKIPYERSKNLRLDFDMGEGDVSPIYLYDIEFSNLLITRVIPAETVSLYFEGINGAIVERLGSSLKLEINGENQYIVSTPFPKPYVRYNYISIICLCILAIILGILVYKAISLIYYIIENLLIYKKSNFRIIFTYLFYSFLSTCILLYTWIIINNYFNIILSAILVVMMWIVLQIITFIYVVTISYRKESMYILYKFAIGLVKNKKIVIAILSSITTIFLSLFILIDVNNQQIVKVNFLIKNLQTRNYMFYYDNLSKDYPFDSTFSINGTIEGMIDQQELEFLVPYNRIENLRIDLGFNENEISPIYFYSIHINSLFYNSTIPTKDVIHYFYGINGAEKEVLDDSLKITITGIDQYVVSTAYPKPIITSFNYTAIMTFIFFGIIMYFIVFGFYFFIFYGWSLRKNYCKTSKRFILDVILGVYIANILLISGYILQYQSIYKTIIWIENYTANYFTSFIFLFLLYIIIEALSARIWVTTLSLSILYMIPVLINHYKLLYRGTPFFPWDITLASEVKSVIDGIKIELNNITVNIIAIALILILSTYLIPSLKFGSLKRNIIIRGGIASCSILLTAIYINVIYLSNIFAISAWDTNAIYEEYGFYNAFMAEIKCINEDKPQDYSEKTMLSVIEKVDKLINTEDEKEKGIKPNIIIIMSESFWDVGKLPNVKFSEELLPTINKLRDDAISGNLLCSIFGGGTSSTEFEVLTGFTKEFLPIESTPYQQIVTKEFFSLAKYLKKHDYSTWSMHPYLGKNWNRNVAYPNMGFDSFLTMDAFVNPEIKRNFISDVEVTKKIIAEYEQYLSTNTSAPWLSFTVSVQNHPAYSSDRWDDSELVDLNNKNLSHDVEDGLKDLATGLHYSDKALGELIKYFDNVEEPTIIVFFGDHMTGFGDSMYKGFEETGYLTSNSNVEKNYKLHLSTMAAWSNYTNVKYDLGDISSYQLMPTIMKLYGLERPDFFKFLNVLYDASPGLSLGIVLNSDQTYSTIMTEKQKELYHMYELIQYDYIYGNNYIGNEFFGY